MEIKEIVCKKELLREGVQDEGRNRNTEENERVKMEREEKIRRKEEREIAKWSAEEGSIA